MIVKEVYAKQILSKSKVADYTINPYIGCEHGCTYCYARFMKRFTRHKEKWGQFVDVKINAVSLLQREIQKRRIGKVWISGVCDPYQPLEVQYELTRGCLGVLLAYDWPITIQTKSPLVLRDIDLLKQFTDCEVGLSITTAHDGIRRLFEPNVPPINQRIETLAKLHSAGLQTFAMIAPILPEAEQLISRLKGNVDYILIDKMNYHYADWVYKKNKLEYALSEEFFQLNKIDLANACHKAGISNQILYG
ncbi:radical SAM protein [Candidatus Bathyarchaeota archaeon]|nr:MAG: radical SAM protein [Candidatus Bathyarchaeota archaeon]